MNNLKTAIMGKNSKYVCFQKTVCLLITIISVLVTENILAQTSTCLVDISKPGAMVAPICRGQQIEEFNHQFQGGLYAQLINNPSFEEVNPKGENTPLVNWKLVMNGESKGTISAQSLVETQMLNSNQYHCLKLEISSVASGNVGIENKGYWGIKLENNALYKVSFWARKDTGFTGSIVAALESNTGKVYAQSAGFKPNGKWQHFVCDLKPKGISQVNGDNRFVLYATSPGCVYFDVITVMPPTWKNRPNGLRRDLGEKLADLKLKYIQYPGGCDSEFASLDSCRNWKNSIGPLEQRSGSGRHRWEYKNDLYFGLDEYLQLCEDLGAEPVYTISSGVSEMPDNSGNKAWFGVCPLDKMQPIIDNTLDLIEYCNGPVSSTWGARRAANGHPKPYHLKYIEIGNENGFPETEKVYRERYPIIRSAILSQYPDMKIMFNGNREGISSPSGEQVDFIDEHFYSSDLSGYYNRYDTIDPACKKICVAEYASSKNGNGGDAIGNFGDALNDAVFMLGCEKNSERMWWTGYGNYAGFVGHSNFGPCIVWNDAVTCFASPSYYMQKMLFADNSGTRILPFAQNTNCFWSASIDTHSEKKDVLLKVVNKNATPETVQVTIKGIEKIQSKGHSETLTAPLEAENSIANPHNVVPANGSFMASDNFSYTFKANSITVLRINVEY